MKTTPAPILRYPISNVKAGDDYFKIQIVEYKAPGLNLGGGFALRTFEDAFNDELIKNDNDLKKLIKGTIILPMPSNIQDSTAASWTSGTMNPLQTQIAAAASNGVLDKDFLSSLFQSVIKTGSNAVKVVDTGEGQKAVAALTAAAAQMAALGQGDINAALTRQAGAVFNQNAELLFDGIIMRPAFNFSFDIVPRSQKEANTIKDIIRLLKITMSPRKGNPNVQGQGLFIKAPNVYKLQYMSGGKQHPFLHQFKTCALTQMSVNYNNSGQYMTYSDATPVSMNLALQFQELTPIYREDYLSDPEDYETFKLPGTGF
jgi:hypothetical protein